MFMEKVTHDVTTLEETFLMAYIWKRSRPQNSQSRIDSGLTNAEMENWKGTATEHILFCNLFIRLMHASLFGKG